MTAVMAAPVGTSAPDIAIPYHLTPRPWAPLGISRESLLEAVEALCRSLARWQDTRGAIVDPNLRREHYFSTPYFVFGAAVLMAEGRALDLQERAALAMDHSTGCVAAGLLKIPNECGEFYIGPLVQALDLLRCRIRGERWNTWQKRLRTPVAQVVGSGQLHLNHWRAYAMMGEWLRARSALVDRNAARDFIERHWKDNQRDRLRTDRLGLYQDHGSDPESFALDAAGRVGLLCLAGGEYSGPSAPEMVRMAERGTAASLLLQDPSGQCPPNGLGDNHVFHDALYLTAFEQMAARARERRQPWLAGQYRRAALLAFQSTGRWRRPDGSCSVVKNRYAPELRAGYQPASGEAWCNAALMLHMAEAARNWSGDITEQPAPAEIGGYGFTADAAFSTAFANAGGMQMVANLRGDAKGSYGVNWTALGLVRFARAGWDSRLGPSDGMRDQSGRGVSFAPTWSDRGRWVRLADVPEHYRGTFSVAVAHPLLVRCAVEYASTERGAPAFTMDCIVTPDGVLVRVSTRAAVQWGVTWPLLVNDGQALETTLGRYTASVRYPGCTDEQNFIALGAEPMLANEEPVRGSYGLLRPVRARAPLTFIYPRTAADPPAEDVRASFRVYEDGFSSLLGRVCGNVYVGRTAAGGLADAIDLNGDGMPEVTFSVECGFILQLKDGQIVALEADRDVAASVAGQPLELTAFQPVTLG